MIWSAQDWKEYELLDAGHGERLERWGTVTVRRPDPQVLWASHPAYTSQWSNVMATYHRSPSGGGQWEMHTPLPERWHVCYDSLHYWVRPTSFKHMGLFPEQATNWQWLSQKIKQAKRPIKLLNLFAYTGGVTIATAQAGASVCHVDAAKGMVAWAKENATLNRLDAQSVRWITDDVFKFVQREQRRGSTYDAIVMDPPSYGRGPGGELWKVETHLYSLIASCATLLSATPLLFMVNSYTAGLSSTVIANVLQQCVVSRHGGLLESGEIGLPLTSDPTLVLPSGSTCRWHFPPTTHTKH